MVIDTYLTAYNMQHICCKLTITHFRLLDKNIRRTEDSNRKHNTSSMVNTETSH